MLCGSPFGAVLNGSQVSIFSGGGARGGTPGEQIGRGAGGGKGGNSGGGGFFKKKKKKDDEVGCIDKKKRVARHAGGDGDKVDRREGRRRGSVSLSTQAPRDRQYYRGAQQDSRLE